MHCHSFEPKPNYRLADLPYDPDYREGLENERPVMRMDSIVIALAITIGAVILGLVFWPVLMEFIR